MPAADVHVGLRLPITQSNRNHIGCFYTLSPTHASDTPKKAARTTEKAKPILWSQKCMYPGKSPSIGSTIQRTGRTAERNWIESYRPSGLGPILERSQSPSFLTTSARVSPVRLPIAKLLAVGHADISAVSVLANFLS